MKKKPILPKPPSGVSASSNSVASTVVNNGVSSSMSVSQGQSTNSMNNGANVTLLPQGTHLPQPLLMGGVGPLQFTLRPPQPQPVLQGSPGVQILPQPLLIQGSGGGFVPVQLTLRTSMPQVVSPNPSLTISNSSLLGALSSPAPHVVVSSSPSLQSTPIVVQTSLGSGSQTRLVSPAGQTIVLPSQNIFAPRQNIVFSRPGGPSFISNQQPTMMSNSPVLQIQTANGPMFVTLQTQPNIPNNQSTSLLSSQSGPTVLQSPFSTTLFGTHNSGDLSAPPTNPTFQTNNIQASPGKSKSPAKGVNLADLLKESGILESSPPSSPTKDDIHPSTASITHQPPTVIMMPPPGNGGQPNFLLSPQIQSQVTPQLRLTTDGRLVLTQGSIQGLDALLSGAQQGMEKPQLSPDSTTPDPSGESGAPCGSGKIRQEESLKSTHKIKEEDDKKVAHITTSVTNQSVPDLNSTTVIRIGNCDRHVQTSTLPIILPTTDKEDKKMVDTREPTSSSTSSTMSGPVVKISLDDNEFFDRLETQIKSFSSMESLSQEQKDLYQELQSLHKTILEARQKKFQSSQGVCTNGDSSSGSTPMKVLIAVPPRINLSGQPETSTQSQLILNSNTQPNPPTNIQLVNILKQGSPNNQLRLVSAPTVTSTAEQVLQSMPQIITISSSAKTPGSVTLSSSIQTQLHKLPQTSQTLIQVVRLQPPPATGSVASVVPPSTASEKTPSDPVIEEEKLRQQTIKLFRQQLDSDQRVALRPNIKTPFRNRSDACKRLIRYHVFQNADKHYDFEEIDRLFEDTAYNLLIKKQSLFDRYQRCLLRGSLRTDTHEKIMLDKLFINDETTSLKLDKDVVAQGIPLDLPPPPNSWQNALATMNTSETEKEPPRPFKRSFLDADLSESTVEPKRHPPVPSPPTFKDDDDTEDEEDDSEDDDDDEDEDANLADDMSEYLGPNDTENVDINSIYDEIEYDHQVRSSIDFNFCNRTSNDWNSSYPKASGGTWRNFNDAEAAVAVDSILTSPEDCGKETDSGPNLDLSVLAETGERELPEGNFVFAEVENGLSQRQSNESCDPQMQCAIDSILMDATQSSSGAYFVHNESFSRNYPSGGLSTSRSSSMMPPFGHAMQGQVSDPALDEAVKSILS